jgi:hypothetical protein
LKFLKSGFVSLLLLDSVPLPGEVGDDGNAIASGEFIEHGVRVEPCFVGDLPYPFATPWIVFLGGLKIPFRDGKRT